MKWAEVKTLALLGEVMKRHGREPEDTADLAAVAGVLVGELRDKARELLARGRKLERDAKALEQGLVAMGEIDEHSDAGHVVGKGAGDEHMGEADHGG
jgi:hypothetical protein